MMILLYYYYAAHSVGRYWEEALKDAGHSVVCCGPGNSIDRAGDAPSIDLGAFVRHRHLSPDLFIYVDSPSFPRNVHRLSCPTVAYFVDVHLGETWKSKAARLFDHVYIAQRDYLCEFEQAGNSHVVWLPLACHPSVHTVEGAEHRTYDVACIGQRSGAHAERVRLQGLIEPLYRVKFADRTLREEMARIYGASRIVFNKSINGDVNMRVFEGLASGAMVLTDQVGNGLEELFRPGEDLVTYRGALDLLQKLDHYLQREEERRRIATAGQAKVLAGHTYAHRVAAVLSAVQSRSAVVDRNLPPPHAYRVYATAHAAIHDTRTAWSEIVSAWHDSRPQLQDVLLAAKCLGSRCQPWERSAVTMVTKVSRCWR